MIFRRNSGMPRNHLGFHLAYPANRVPLTGSDSGFPLVSLCQRQAGDTSFIPIAVP